MVKGEIFTNLTRFGYTKPIRQINTVNEDINKGLNPGVGRSVGKYCFKIPVKASCINQPKIKPKKMAKTPNSIKIKEYRSLISQDSVPKLFKMATYSTCRRANLCELIPTVKAAIRTASNPPSKKKFPDLSIAFPRESLASWASLISSPGCFVFSKILFASKSSSFSPK